MWWLVNKSAKEGTTVNTVKNGDESSRRLTKTGSPMEVFSEKTRANLEDSSRNPDFCH